MARILVIEDDPSSRKLASAILRNAGHEVSVAGDTWSAERELEQGTPDLIVTDLALPGKDGCTFTRELRNRPRTAATPIVAVTAYSGVWSEREARQAGCNDYLRKPFDRPEFVRRVNRWLSIARGRSV